MAAIICDMPAGGTAGDIYLLHVRSEMEDEPTVSVSGFVPLAAGGGPYQWNYLLTRDHDGAEDPTTVVDGFDNTFVQAQCLLIRDGDDLELGAFATFDTDPADELTIDVAAVTTTVDDTLVLIGFATYDWFDTGGPAVTAGVVDDQVVLYDHDSVSIWSVTQAVAGSAGPWTIDRTLEVTALPPRGGSTWTLLVTPASTAPTIVAVTTVADFAANVGDPTQPPPQLITNPHNPSESAWIGGATLAELEANIAAQLAEWDLEAGLPDDAGGAFDDHVEDDIAANLEWLAAHADWDPQTVRLTSQLTRLMRKVADTP